MRAGAEGQVAEVRRLRYRQFSPTLANQAMMQEDSVGGMRDHVYASGRPHLRQLLLELLLRLLGLLLAAAMCGKRVLELCPAGASTIRCRFHKRTGTRCCSRGICPVPRAQSLSGCSTKLRPQLAPFCDLGRVPRFL